MENENVAYEPLSNYDVAHVLTDRHSSFIRWCV